MSNFPFLFHFSGYSSLIFFDYFYVFLFMFCHLSMFFMFPVFSLVCSFFYFYYLFVLMFFYFRCHVLSSPGLASGCILPTSVLAIWLV